MVHHLVAAAELRVLVREGVEAMWAGVNDPLHARRVQGSAVLLGQTLEGVLVAHPACRVAGAGFPWPEDREVDSSGLHKLRRRDRPLAGALVESWGAADPEQDVRGLFSRLQHVDAQ